MKQITLKTTERTEIGRTPSKHLREKGVVPAVIYGEHGTRHLSVNAHEFAMAYRKFSGSAALLELKGEDGGESTYAIIQELQRNPRNENFIHIDFKEIVRGKDMETSIPIHTKGTADGVRNYGGILELALHEVEVRCRPRNLPEFIEIDVTGLEIGKSMHLGEIEAPEGVTFLDDPDRVVVACVGASSGASGVVDEDEEAEDEVAEGEGAEAASESESSEEDTDKEG